MIQMNDDQGGPRQEETPTTAQVNDPDPPSTPEPSQMTREDIDKMHDMLLNADTLAEYREGATHHSLKVFPPTNPNCVYDLSYTPSANEVQRNYSVNVLLRGQIGEWKKMITETTKTSHLPGVGFLPESAWERTKFTCVQTNCSFEEVLDLPPQSLWSKLSNDNLPELDEGALIKGNVDENQLWHSPYLQSCKWQKGEADGRQQSQTNDDDARKCVFSLIKCVDSEVLDVILRDVVSKSQISLARARGLEEKSAAAPNVSKPPDHQVYLVINLTTPCLMALVSSEKFTNPTQTGVAKLLNVPYLDSLFGTGYTFGLGMKTGAYAWLTEKLVSIFDKECQLESFHNVLLESCRMEYHSMNPFSRMFTTPIANVLRNADRRLEGGYDAHGFTANNKAKFTLFYVVRLICYRFVTRQGMEESDRDVNMFNAIGRFVFEHKDPRRQRLCGQALYFILNGASRLNPQGARVEDTRTVAQKQVATHLGNMQAALVALKAAWFSTESVHLVMETTALAAHTFVDQLIASANGFAFWTITTKAGVTTGQFFLPLPMLGGAFPVATGIAGALTIGNAVLGAVFAIILLQSTMHVVKDFWAWFSSNFDVVMKNATIIMVQQDTFAFMLPAFGLQTNDGQTRRTNRRWGPVRTALGIESAPLPSGTAEENM